MAAIQNRSLHKPLQDAGLVPEDCRLMEIRIGVDGAIVVHYEVFLSVEKLATLGRIFEAVAIENNASLPPLPPELDPPVS